MQIAGIQKTTLVDYPGKVAATIFTRGCTFRCPFCHNPELVIPEKFISLFEEEEIFEFLEKRIGKLQAVCITGGEPTIQADILEFIDRVKKMGFLIKLDSNGSLPEMLEKIIQTGNIDYIAMDIKSPLNKYSKATGTSVKSQEPSGSALGPRPSQLEQAIKKSVALIMNSGIDYEFRTTVCHPIHEVEDFEEIGKLIKGPKGAPFGGAKRYFIQNFVQSKHNDELTKFTPFSDEELEESKKIIEHYIKEVKVR